MIYTVTLNPAIDHVVHLGEVRPGEVNRSNAEEMFVGGKGINVSAVLSELDIGSVVLGFTAGFTGQAIEQGVREMGLTSELIRLPDGNSRINVKIKTDTETEINGQGPDIDEVSLGKLFERLGRLKDGDTLILAGSIPRSLPPDVYQRILASLSGRDIRAVVDASGELLLNVLKYRPFLIKPNNFELEEITGRPLRSDDDIIMAARELQKAGAANVLVTMAENGALLLDERGEVHRCGVCRGTVKNSVGAGDSMVAGFVAGLIMEGSFEYALRLGTACGGATAFSGGLAKRELIFELLKQI